MHPTPIKTQLATSTKTEAHGTSSQYCFGVWMVSFASIATCCSLATTPMKVYSNPRRGQLLRLELNNSNSDSYSWAEVKMNLDHIPKLILNKSASIGIGELPAKQSRHPKQCVSCNLPAKRKQREKRVK